MPVPKEPVGPTPPPVVWSWQDGADPVIAADDGAEPIIVALDGADDSG